MVINTEQLIMELSEEKIMTCSLLNSFFLFLTSRNNTSFVLKAFVPQHHCFSYFKEVSKQKLG